MTRTTQNMSKKMRLMGALMASTLTSGLSWAVTDSSAVELNSVSVDVVRSDDMRLDGRFDREEEEEFSAEDRIDDARNKAEEKNVEKLATKIENIKIPTEVAKEIQASEKQEMTERVKGLFDTGEGTTTGTTGSTPTTSGTGAPTSSHTHAGQATLNTSGYPLISVIPSYALSAIKGEGIDFESNMNLGLTIQGMVHRNVAIALTGNYATLEISELDQSSSIYDWNSYARSYYGSRYNDAQFNGYRQFYGGRNRRLDYSHLSVDLSGKFYLWPYSVVRPYVGAGIAYNRTNLQYQDKGRAYTNSYYQTNYGNEAFIGNYISGTLMLGTEVRFSEFVGLDVNLKYGHGLSTNFNNKSQAINEDQMRLDQVGANIANSHFLSIGAGLIIGF